MATALKDVEPIARGGMGHNEPPLEDRTLLAFDEALNDHEGLLARIAAMVEKAAKAGPCKTDEDAGRMADFVAMTKAAVKVIDAEREILNRPLLATQRSLKARADALSNQASNAGLTVRRLMDAYLEEKELARRKEEARLAEIERQAALARQAIIDEANRKAAREAEAERKRLQDIADANAEIERRRLQAIADAEAAVERERLQKIEAERAAAEAREVVEVVVEAKVVEVAAEVVEVEAAPVLSVEMPQFVATARPVSKVQGDLGTRVGLVETWHVEIENIRQVPDLFLKNEAVLEALRKVIAPSVRGKTGLRTIKGCRIYPTLGSSVRG